MSLPTPFLPMMLSLLLHPAGTVSDWYPRQLSSETSDRHPAFTSAALRNDGAGIGAGDDEPAHATSVAPDTTMAARRESVRRQREVIMGQT